MSLFIFRNSHLFILFLLFNNIQAYASDECFRVVKEEGIKQTEPQKKLASTLTLPITSLELPYRLLLMLKNIGINSIGDLVVKTEQEAKKMILPGFGKRFFKRLVEQLWKQSLYLGMDISWQTEPTALDTLVERVSVKNPHIPKSKLNYIFRSPIERLGLSTRISNKLKSWRVYFIGELIIKTEREIREKEGFGKMSLKNIKEQLGKGGLDIDINSEGSLDPEKIEVFFKKLIAKPL